MIRSFLLAALALFGSSQTALAAVLPLKPSENGRFLVDQKGQPFMVAGDAGWSVIVQLTEEDVDRYLDDRAKRGFTSIMVSSSNTNSPRSLPRRGPAGAI